jgi:prepilin-type N-terminal cleavage/methylation domain-containing protein
MFQRLKNQQGFGIIEMLLVIILLSLVGFIGYYVYHANNKATDTYDQTTNASSAQPIANKPSASSPQDYLAIQQWGVKLPLTSDLSGAYYVSKNSTVYLSLDKYKGTDCAADQVSLGSLSRFTSTDRDEDGKSMLSNVPTATKVNNWYYYYQQPQANCSGSTPESGARANEEAEFAKASALMSSFKAAAKLITAN